MPLAQVPGGQGGRLAAVADAMPPSDSRHVRTDPFGSRRALNSAGEVDTRAHLTSDESMVRSLRTYDATSALLRPELGTIALLAA